MAVELEVMKGINPVTKEVVTYEIYKIWYEDEQGKRDMVGTTGWAKGKPIVFNQPVDPITKEIIVEGVKKIKKDEAELVVRVPMDVRDLPSLDQLPPQTKESLDEFDEEDLIG